jgi:TRAP-type C4-dicarboxylate transport system substrate-binding protein
MIQGQENPMFFVESTRMYEVTDYITFTGHNNFTTAFMANKDFFDSLPEADQALVRDAVDVAFDYILEYQDGLTERALAAIKAERPDIEVVVLTEEQRQPFMDAAERVEAEFIRMTGERGQQILEQMKKDLAAASASN